MTDPGGSADNYYVVKKSEGKRMKRRVGTRLSHSRRRARSLRISRSEDAWSGTTGRQILAVGESRVVASAGGPPKGETSGGERVKQAFRNEALLYCSREIHLCRLRSRAKAIPTIPVGRYCIGCLKCVDLNTIPECLPRNQKALPLLLSVS